MRLSCANCGGAFETPRSDKRFCRTSCQEAFGNRMAARGKVVMPLVMAWIAGKGGGHAGTHPVAGKALSEITSIVRDFLDEDREKNRPPAIDYAESLFAGGLLYMDRKRR